MALETTMGWKVPTYKTRAHQEMRCPNVTWRIILYDYLFTSILPNRDVCV